jgi:hypothetical protein
VPNEPRAPEPAAERVGREVAGHRAGPRDRDQHEQRDLALPGDHAADDHGRLARRDQADEGAGLQERRHADEQVGPGPERLPDVRDQLLEIGERDQADADGRPHGHADPRRDLEPAVERAPARVQHDRRHRRAEQPAPPHAARTFAKPAPTGSAATARPPSRRAAGPSAA